MKRTKPAGSPSSSGMDARNMSYTNLASLASEFENSAISSSVVSSLRAGAPGSSEACRLRHAVQKGDGLINRSLKLDLNNPMQASELYQQGSEYLASALERAEPGSQSEEMQRTLDMVEERVRLITREAVGRSGSDSQITTDAPTSPISPVDGDFKQPELAKIAENRASNYFDMSDPESLFSRH